MMRSTTTILLAAALLAFAFLPAALAGDEPAGDSPAEQAYRDAWWAETSAGALDRALEGYRKAVDAEGPEAVRAQALYRMAVVLERIGKTDEAIRALERLAKDFAAETDLLAQARDRLEAWTAVDLRTGFDEWYRRYQYSPEFQARVVELVLKMSAAKPEDVQSIKQELLTIGAPAIPALKAHLDSSNQELRSRCVDLLLKLGEIPPVRHLLETDLWYRTAAGGADNWRALLTAPEDARERLRVELDATGDDGDLARAIRSILDGRQGWARAVEILTNSNLVSAVLSADPGEEVLKQLWALVGEMDPESTGSLAGRLLQSGRVPNDVALAWLDLPLVRQDVARRIWEGRLCDPSAWRAVVDAMDALPVDDDDQSLLFSALAGALRDAPADADVTPAVRAFERVAPARKVRLSSGRSGRRAQTPPGTWSTFLEATVDLTRDPGIAYEALKSWLDLHKEDADVSRRLVAWARAKASLELTFPAAAYAGQHATEATLDDVLDALPTLDAETAGRLLAGLQQNRFFNALPWTDERVLKLHAYAQALEEQAASTDEASSLFRTLHAVPDRVDQLARLFLDAPRRVWLHALDSQTSATTRYLQDEALREKIRSGFVSRWPRWSPEQRLAAVRFLPAWTQGLRDDEFVAFLRAELRVPTDARGIKAREDPEHLVRLAIFRLLPSCDMVDLRAVFQITKPDGALAAWAEDKIPLTAETYDALGAARRSDDFDARYAFYMRWVNQGPAEVQPRAARDMLNDESPRIRMAGVSKLGSFRSGDDVRRFEKALGDPDAGVRYEAATALAGAYDRQAIEALVKALDDPVPTVRDRVLLTLEAIKQIEEKKEYWKEFIDKTR